MDQVTGSAIASSEPHPLAGNPQVPLRGAAGHKGRVGDGVERLLVGAKVPGMAADHPAAEIKSVPVAGDGVVERVRLGVLSPRSNPLAKCDRILFVFVEKRASDFFIAGHHAREFTFDAWTQMWRDGWIVETVEDEDETWLLPQAGAEGRQEDTEGDRTGPTADGVDGVVSLSEIGGDVGGWATNPLGR